ncbi:hypothetical protein D3C76_1573560 [compost metagenome]
MAAAHTAAGIDVACIATIANAPNAIALIPDSRPSSPSVKLTALVIASIMNTTNG